MRRLAVTLVTASLIAVGLAGCGTDSGATSSSSPSSGASVSPPLSGNITVFAAASLTGTFTQLGKRFESANPGTKVTFSFAASSALAQQISSGAPADVFASASPKNMDQVVSAGAASGSTVFATNTMEIATPPSNPAHVVSVGDLAKSSVKTALCQPQVPCGSVARRVFTNAKIQVSPVTLEPDVKSVLTKVQLGEVDAGVVYVTDVKAGGDKVRGVQISDAVNASTAYSIASLAKSGDPAVASAFVDSVLSPGGESVLSAAGFSAP